MDLYDLLFFDIFMVIWLFLVIKVFPKYGVGGWAVPPRNLQVEDDKATENDGLEENKNNECK